MKRMLIIGCGDVAARAIPSLLRRYRIFALARNPAQFARLRALGVLPLYGNLDVRNSLARIAGLSDVVLHFAPPASGFAAQQGCDLRTRHLLAALGGGKLPEKLIYISTSGVYGDCGGAFIDETHPPRPQSARGLLRLDAERQIRAFARRNHIIACILRVPGIYAADRLPLQRLRAGLPAILGCEDSYINHIHADDLARIAQAALSHGKACRIYHACCDSQLKMGDYYDAVADASGLPRPPRIPRCEALRVLPEASFLQESRRLDNRRLKRELGVKLRYPTVADFLRGL